jgi:hypothetical protein
MHDFLGSHEGHEENLFGTSNVFFVVFVFSWQRMRRVGNHTSRSSLAMCSRLTEIPEAPEFAMRIPNSKFPIPNSKFYWRGMNSIVISFSSVSFSPGTSFSAAFNCSGVVAACRRPASVSSLRT